MRSEVIKHLSVAMSVTLKLVSRGLSSPLISNRLNGFAGILSNGHITGLIDAYKIVPQRNLHQSCLSPSLSVGNISKSQTMSQSFSSFANVHKIVRHYSSQSVKDNSLGNIVYKGRVSKMLKTLKVFSITTSAFGLAVQPYLWITFQNMSLVAALPLFTVINGFVFLNPFLIHYIAKKYVTDLYFNSDTNVFTAHVLTFFAGKETITFVAADVDVPDVPNMFAMLNVRGRPLFVQEDDFTNIAVYKHLMGFDQPLDITLLHEERKDAGYIHDEKKDSS